MPKVDANLKQQILNEIMTDGATPQECADRYDIPAGTIRSWLSRAKAKGDTQPKPQRNGATQRKKEKSATQRKSTEPAVTIEDVSEDLTEKERLFCWRYIHNFNATQAYLWAFNCAYSTAMVEGCKMLRKPNVKAEIARLKKLKFEALQISAEDIVERYMRIAFADMTDFVEFGRVEVPVMAAFGPIMIENEETGEKVPLMKEVNDIRFKESHLVDGGLICQVKQGRDGASIKLEDRQKSLDWLANYFEMNPMDKHKRRYDEERLKIEREKLEKENDPATNQNITIVDDIK